MKVLFFSLTAAVALASVAATEEAHQDPSVWMTVQHEVEDFATWRAVFDSGLYTRISAGELAFVIMQDPANPNDVTAIFEWSTREQAHAFVHDPSIRNAMAYRSVISDPVVTFSAQLPHRARHDLMVATNTSNNVE